jgi:hypothetical protein
MTGGNAARFLKAMEILAPADKTGLRIFKVRGKSTCVADMKPLQDGTVGVRSLVSISEGASGRSAAMAAVCYFADIFDVTLRADGGVVLRDIDGFMAEHEWLADYDFVAPRGQSFMIRPPQSIHRIAA